MEIKRRCPDCTVTVFEAAAKPMAKLAITGGGRCNITNSFEGISALKEAYPRGTALVKRAFRLFDHVDTVRWWEREGVKLTLQPDNCWFPVSQDAMEVVHTLERLMQRLGVKLVCNTRLSSITQTSAVTPASGLTVHPDTTKDSVRPGRGGLTLDLIGEKGAFSVAADCVVLTTGGTKADTLRSLLPPGIEVTPTLPSLFTFKVPDSELHSLMGIVVPRTTLTLAGTGLHSSGALLVTDWGVSGPSVLKLSSYGARILAESQYQAKLVVNWLSAGEQEVGEWVDTRVKKDTQKMLANTWPEALSSRLWAYLLKRAGLREDLRWAELGTKGRSRLIGILTACELEICGRAKFKEEFVTCGGVDTSCVDMNTMECKQCRGLFFAGEVLDVDAITGGFNLQAAWSTAYAAANGVASFLGAQDIA